MPVTSSELDRVAPQPIVVCEGVFIVPWRNPPPAVDALLKEWGMSTEPQPLSQLRKPKPNGRWFYMSILMLFWCLSTCLALVFCRPSVHTYTKRSPPTPAIQFPDLRAGGRYYYHI